mmetsp:Transcript_38623/g.83982  ORF Transcript_38623/g.83982 Transcript_38623/m.83982 type:complete len:254 (+) Transcript_38623:177-938(+)|eukprot:CAMPEP_0118935754 /NCGR_PEP_ID=MMETSP1169-20130426/15815_1 /TAXON_ID=36882 /ORGANISM="Pyramimonas obovata, Strain CCMP722" /LENGTH=253 /DNA_ID=CAMNT_0006878815 /DNA_START=177 /DNA_END=938 /DNA_ORIENTATION=+
MTKRVNLGDASTWATRAVDEVKSLASKLDPSSKTGKSEEVQSSQRTGKISLPKWEDPVAPKLVNGNSPFVPRKAWDTAVREKYVVKYPAGYDPVTRSFKPQKSKTAEPSTSAEVVPKQQSAPRFGKAAVQKWLSMQGIKARKTSSHAKGSPSNEKVVARKQEPAKFGKAAKLRLLHQKQQEASASAAQTSNGAGDAKNRRVTVRVTDHIRNFISGKRKVEEHNGRDEEGEQTDLRALLSKRKKGSGVFSRLEG